MRKKIVSISLILSCFAVFSLSAQEADETVQVDGIESTPGVDSHDGCGCGKGKPK